MCATARAGSVVSIGLDDRSIVKASWCRLIAALFLEQTLSDRLNPSPSQEALFAGRIENQLQTQSD